jgi:nucleolar protein 56
MYARVVALIKNRKELTDDLLGQLEEVVMDSSKAQAIIDASKMSMGMIFFFLNLLPLFGISAGPFLFWMQKCFSKI